MQNGKSISEAMSEFELNEKSSFSDFKSSLNKQFNMLKSDIT